LPLAVGPSRTITSGLVEDITIFLPVSCQTSLSEAF
jgi:hypothetical protein